MPDHLCAARNRYAESLSWRLDDEPSVGELGLRASGQIRLFMEAREISEEFAGVRGPLQCAVEHSKLAGLQVADAVASGFHFALKVNRYGETETSYLPHLKKTIYRHKSVALGYGLKLWPEDFSTVKTKASEAVNLEGL